MLRHNFVISRYDWHVQVYFYNTCYYVDEIINKVKKLNADINTITDIYNNIINDKLNTGITFSDLENKETVMVISKTSTPEQFMNSYDHERQHLIDHITERFNLPARGEETAYLAGDIGQLMFPKAKYFLCKCHCEF